MEVKCRHGSADRTYARGGKARDTGGQRVGRATAVPELVVIRCGVPEQPTGVRSREVHRGVVRPAGIEPSLPALCGPENRVDVVAIHWLVVHCGDVVTLGLVHEEAVYKELRAAAATGSRRVSSVFVR
jgi:hypothetical protein